ncbi:MAG: serine hydrolase [Verrucomicrobiota bacterium]
MKPTAILTLLSVSVSFSFSVLAQPAGALQQRFDRFDTNGDGKLSAEEIPSPRLFERLDKDGDGFVSLEESRTLGGSGGRGQGEPAMPTTDPQPGVKPENETEIATNFSPRQHGEEATRAGLDPDTLGKLDIAMETAVAKKEVSGVVGLLYRNGERGYFESFGWQEIESEKPMPLDGIFRLQSMSKPIVTVAALVLHEEGKFDLDEPISKHLPEWTEPKVLKDGELVPARTQITPRMLMSHSSGLYYGSLPGHPMPRTKSENPKAHSELLAKQPLKFHPGEGNQYGTSIDVLGRYCEAISGKPLDVVVKETVLDPLKMVDTDFWVPPAKSDRIVQLYRQESPGTLRRGREASQLTTKPTMFLGGQGLCATTADYERFCLMLLNGGELDGVRVLRPETVDAIFTNQLEHIGARYGLGGSVNDEGGYAWGGANGTQFWVDRPNEMIGIFMVQTERYRAPTFGAFRSLAREAVVE